MSFSTEEIAHLNRIVRQATVDPQLLHTEQLSGLRDFVQHFGGKIPVKKEEPKPETKADEPKQQEPQHADPQPPVASEVSEDSEVEEFVEEADPEVCAEREPAAEHAGYSAPTGQGTEDEAALEAAVEQKAAAQDLCNEEKYEQAVAKMTTALAAKTTSAMYWAFRSQIYLQWKKPNCAIADATRALEINPDSARALRVRGTARRLLGQWEAASADLNQANLIDFDDSPSGAALVKLVTERANKIRHHKRRVEQHAEKKRRKDLLRRQEELKRQRQREMEEEAQERAKARANMPDMSGMPGGMGGMPGGMGGMPGGMGGMPGGMGGMGGMPGMGGGAGGIPPGMAEVFEDPEIQEAMKDPETAAKLAQVMQNPMAAMQMLQDPKMGPILQKLMSKMGGGAGPGMGGMPGGMGGMGGGRGRGGGAPPPPQQAPKTAPPKHNVNDDLD